MSDPASDQLFIRLATSAFRMGLADGRTWARPRDSHEVMRAIGASIPDQRVLHRTKLRQVYGAGFDIARLEAK